LTGQLNRTQLELREAETSRDALKKEVSGEEPLLLPDEAPAAAGGSGVAVPEIDGRLDALKKNLDTLSTRYTDQHPDVVAVKRQISELEEQKTQVVAARKKEERASRKGPSLQGNAVYQQLRVSLAESEALVAQLRTRVTEYESRLAKHKDRASLPPDGKRVFAAQSRLRRPQAELRNAGQPPRAGRNVRRHAKRVRR
jgi:chromosome segregation ATPase